MSAAPPFTDWSGLVGTYSGAMSNVPTLYEWAGGDEALQRLINAFYDRVEADDLLSGFFPGGVHEEHRRHVTTWWGEVFGGPSTYTERWPRVLGTLGGHPIGNFATPSSRHPADPQRPSRNRGNSSSLSRC